MHFSLFGKLTNLYTSVKQPNTFSLDGHTIALHSSSKLCRTEHYVGSLPLSLILHLFPVRLLQIMAIYQSAMPAALKGS